jgi:hypothetical protein
MVKVSNDQCSKNAKVLRSLLQWKCQSQKKCHKLFALEKLYNIFNILYQFKNLLVRDPGLFVKAQNRFGLWYPCYIYTACVKYISHTA